MSSPIWGSWPDISYSLTVTVLFSWGALSDERTGLFLYMLLDLASVVFLGSEFLGARDHILLSQIWDFPFRRLLRLSGSRWRYSTPPPCGCIRSSLYSLGGGDPTENTVSIVITQQNLDCCLLIRCRGNLITESLSSSERLFWISGLMTHYEIIPHRGN
jgi:hypothetical protein